MRILCTGATGFLGGAVCAELNRQSIHFIDIPGRRADRDLRRPDEMRDLLRNYHPDVVIHLAYPGTNGIGTSISTPADLAQDVLQIDMNVLRACALAAVPRLICVGSVCAYPEHVAYPTGEDQLWAGYPEPVNAAYGTAKRMQLELLRAYRSQYGLNGLQLILGNLYGPGDRSGHVIPATSRKIRAAKRGNASSIVVWGDGHASREFLYVEDAARAIVTAATLPDLSTPDPVNIVSGEEVSIASLTCQIMDRLHYPVSIQWDASKPNGQPRRRFAYTRATQLLQWAPTVPFPEGLTRTVAAWSAS